MLCPHPAKTSRNRGEEAKQIVQVRSSGKIMITTIFHNILPAKQKISLGETNKWLTTVHAFHEARPLLALWACGRSARALAADRVAARDRSTLPSDLDGSEAVCERISQITISLAQAKIVNSLKLFDLGFSRMLMMGKFIFVIDLAPDDVTSKSIFGQYFVELSCSPSNSAPRAKLSKIQRYLELKYWPKINFDVTSSGANDTSMTKMSLPIVISILENPKSRSFRELTILACANSCLILSQTASY
uniref:Uncharacterized protein n=1 Tax=Pristionchus pacificus TaxID=54126 RepID=A0A8R1Z3G6_PRIPA